MVGRSYSLPRVEGRSSKDGIVGGQAVDNKECNILSDLLRIITNCYGQCDCVKGVYFCPSKPNEWGVGWDQPFSVNPHLLKCRVVEDVSGAFVVNQDPMCVIISYSYANDRCIVMWVVETSSIFLWEFNAGSVDPCHLWDEAYQLDIPNHPKVSLTSLFGRARSCGAFHNHSYVFYMWPRTLVLPSGNLLLWQVRSFLADEPLQLSLSYKSFYLLPQVVAVRYVMTVITVKVAVLVSRPFIGVSLQLAGKCQGFFVFILY